MAQGYGSELWSQAFKGAVAGAFAYVHYSDAGVQEWRLAGESSEFTTAEHVLVSRPTIDVYEVAGNVSFQAGLADVDAKGSTCVLSANVHVSRYDGTAIHAETVYYDFKTKDIEMKGGFTWKREGLVIRGEQAHLDIENGTIKVEGAAQMEVWK
jgi:LPS export ABC transporter protein LptC